MYACMYESIPRPDWLLPEDSQRLPFQITVSLNKS